MDFLTAWNAQSLNAGVLVLVAMGTLIIADVLERVFD